MAKRKMGFYYLHYRNGDEVFEVESGLVRLLQYINAQSNRAKKQDISDDRICFLDFFEYNEDARLLKKCARGQVPLTHERNVTKNKCINGIWINSPHNNAIKTWQPSGRRTRNRR